MCAARVYDERTPSRLRVTSVVIFYMVSALVVRYLFFVIIVYRSIAHRPSRISLLAIRMAIAHGLSYVFLPLLIDGLREQSSTQLHARAAFHLPRAFLIHSLPSASFPCLYYELTYIPFLIYFFSRRRQFIQLIIAVVLLHGLAWVVPESSPLKPQVALPEVNAEMAYKLLPVVSVGVIALGTFPFLSVRARAVIVQVTSRK